MDHETHYEFTETPESKAFPIITQSVASSAQYVAANIQAMSVAKQSLKAPLRNENTPQPAHNRMPSSLSLHWLSRSKQQPTGLLKRIQTLTHTREVLEIFAVYIPLPGIDAWLSRVTRELSQCQQQLKEENLPL